MVLNKKVLNDLLKKSISEESEMQIDEVKENIIDVHLRLKLKKTEKESENKKEVNKEEFKSWTQQFEASFFSSIRNFQWKV